MHENSRKTFVIDTSVLLYDMNSLFNMSGNDIVIPLVVLEELDKFKTREGLLGEYARFFNRFFDELRKLGSLNKGIWYEDSDINIVVSSSYYWDNIDSLDKSTNDNKIIACANLAKRNNPYTEVIVITKDINLRVKCDAVGILSNDYYADYEFIQKDNLYKGYEEIITSHDIINSVYTNKKLLVDKIPEIEKNNVLLTENQFAVLRTDYNNQSCLSVKKGEYICLVEKNSKLGIEPKNKEQTFALDLLMDDKISLVSLTGIPGSGKTYLALMTALKFIEMEKKKRIIFTRPIQTVGKDIGFLPGDISEKMSPWLAPIVDNFRNQFGDLTYFEMMIEKGQIDVAPLSHIRGRSFNDAIIIVDEAQNATVHELKTVITRTGKNSKIILLGDIEQVDLPYINKFSNGLTIIVEKLKNEKITGHVNFEKGYRSELANIAAKII
tara:strand:+ start:31 stop:1347 length:1317 start_codon:yes stop_codon:yes gene_type:complete